MIKTDEISNEESCLNKAADDEPVFVLRAQDRLAPRVIRYWASRATVAGVPAGKVNEAYALAAQMEAWQATHTAKVPD